MSDALYNRLARLRRNATGKQAGSTSRAASTGSHVPTERAANEDDARERTNALERLGFEFRKGCWRRSVTREIGRAAGRVAAREKDRQPGLLGGQGRLLFFDAETTGLSVGAGTVAFLIGAVSVRTHNSVSVEQLLLDDYPAEPEFLQAAAQLLDPENTLVSYNGKGFDTHVLRSRFLMNAVRWEEPKQLDLLYPSRRLWSPTLPDCRLSTIEHRVLGIERSLDIPGAEVPERYFAFLETGVAEVLREVVAHHEQDMVSLVLLYDLIERHFEYTQTRESAGIDEAAGLEEEGMPDPAGFARMLRMRNAELAISFLRRSTDLSAPFGANRRALVLLAGLLRRSGAHESAAEVWSALFHNGRSALAGIELAKFQEHRQKRYDAAFATCQRVGELGLCDRESLERRIKRLTRKIARRRAHS